ncbi:uncharacterized protein BHQ10_003555 [Talaromyces amestolkiae]|uniref:Condensation domain-containing protein n=1 Tax=Talaromyces amestolkiae TaxID=1196081 RepID=A0A364KVH5_TALAM|nr:uncharacterized protein BHQ10_003555 [Talaromyces amestolkiae]RAO67543.1 hypothetical protein BHQ10_003555 [Talaromyces amestolkiae]
MSWVEVASNRFQRPLGENERLIKFIGDRAHTAGREQWSVTSTATFTPCDNRSATEWAATTLRDAWKLLRFRHPSIASTPAGESDSLEYVIPSEKDLEHWIQRSYDVVEGRDSEDVIAEIKPSHFMTLHFLPHTWEIVLHTSHWRTDGYGAFHLLNAFFDAVKAIVDNDGLPEIFWGEEVARLVPSVESALNLPETTTPEITASAIKYASTHTYVKDSVGIPYKGDSTTKPGGTRSVRMQLSTKTTQAIKNATTERPFDMYSAVHAALAKVNFQYASSSASNSARNEQEYASAIRMSLRPHLISPFTDNPSVAAGLYTGGYVSKVTAGDDFSTIAEKYQREYDKGVTPEFIESRRQFAIMALGGLQKGLPPPNPPPSYVDMSFVTGVDDIVKSVFDTKHGPLKVLRVGLGVETLTPQPYLFFWEHRGQLDLSFVYNEAFQNSSDARNMLNSMVDVLENELLGSK